MNRIIYFSFILTCLAGCSSRTFTNTQRAAIEQMLLSGAVDSALEKLDIPQVADKKVYLDFTNLNCYDVEYVKAAVRARFAEIGANLVEDANSADYTAEIASGALGNEFKSFLVGIPAIPVPGLSTPLPKLALARSIEQSGIAKLLISIYADGKSVSTGHYYGKVERRESFILWLRFQPTDDIRKRWQTADEKIKSISSRKDD